MYMYVYVHCMYVCICSFGCKRMKVIYNYKPCDLGHKFITVVSGQVSRHKSSGICKNQQLHF